MVRLGCAFSLVLVGSVLAGCQRLPEPEVPPPSDDSGDSGTTFLPGDSAGDTGDSDGTTEADDGSTTAELPPEVIDCVEGLVIAGDDVSAPSDLAGAHTVEGTLTLTDLSDPLLGWLQCLRQVEGDLIITSSPDLTTLDGLEGLESIAGRLTLQFNDNLQQVDGLSGLVDVGAVDVRHNDALASLEGLEQVATSGTILILDNPALTSVRFDQPTALESLDVVESTELVDLDLPALTDVQWLSIRFCPALLDLDGLSALEHAVGLELRHLGGLVSVDGLSALREVDIRLTLTQVGALTELALPSLERSTGLQVNNAASLVIIELPALQELPEMGLFSMPLLEQLPTLPPQSGLHSFGLAGLPLVATLTPLNLDPAIVEYVALEDMATFDDLSALAGVTVLPGKVSLRSLPSLTSLEAFAGVLQIGNELELVDLPQVTSLAGLEQLQSTGSRVLVQQLPGLASLAGLTSLSSANGLTIEDNANLTSLDGLDTLVQVGIMLRVAENPSLTTIDGLWPIPTGPLDLLPNASAHFVDNPSLSQCTVDDFHQALVDVGWSDMFESSGNSLCPE